MKREDKKEKVNNMKKPPEEQHTEQPQEVSREKVRACLRKLFSLTNTEEMADKAFRLTYPKIEQEKHLPATTELTLSKVGEEAFPLSPRSAFDGLKRFHRHGVMIVRSRWSDTDETGDASGELPPSRGVYTDGHGNMTSPDSVTPQTLLHYIGNLKGRMTAFGKDYLTLYNVAMAEANEEEKQNVQDAFHDLERLCTEIATHVWAVMREQQNGAVSQTPGQILQKVDLRKNELVDDKKDTELH